MNFSGNYPVRALIVMCSLLLFTVGCATIPSVKSTADYEKTGELWGNKHRTESIKPGDIDDKFVIELASKTGVDFFGINADMKEAFVKGYRSGYQDKTADLVLEQHFNVAKTRMAK